MQYLAEGFVNAYIYRVNHIQHFSEVNPVKVCKGRRSVVEHVLGVPMFPSSTSGISSDVKDLPLETVGRRLHCHCESKAA